MLQLRNIMGAAAAMLPLAMADSAGKGYWCGVTAPTESITTDLDSLWSIEKLANKRSVNMWARATNETITIPLAMHAVTKVGQPIDPQMLYDQYYVLVDAYRPYGIEFDLLIMTRYEDDELSFFNSTRFYYYPGENDDRMWYVANTRKGKYDTLNIWFYDDMEEGMNGVCTLPHSDDPEQSLWRDGCHVAMGTMPGGDRTGYNVGYTAVHESGHWLGLLHPWGNEEGHCDGPGDMVSDTPAQSEPAFGCPLNPDSCPGHPGYDNAWNYMDYADDTCDGQQVFTLGQQVRMHNSYNTYRKGK